MRDDLIPANGACIRGMSDRVSPLDAEVLSAPWKNHKCRADWNTPSASGASSSPTYFCTCTVSPAPSAGRFGVVAKYRSWVPPPCNDVTV